MLAGRGADRAPARSPLPSSLDLGYLRCIAPHGQCVGLTGSELFIMIMRFMLIHGSTQLWFIFPNRPPYNYLIKFQTPLLVLIHVF